MSEHDHSADVEEYLRMICRNCKKANKKCIKDDIYIGLCAKNDREELIEMRERKMKMVEIEKRYYACLDFDDGKTIKVMFTNREEARDYIAQHRNDEGVIRSWTE